MNRKPDPTCGIDQNHPPHDWIGGGCVGVGPHRAPLTEADQLRDTLLKWAAGVYPGDYDDFNGSTTHLAMSLLNRTEARTRAPHIEDDALYRNLQAVVIERARQDAKFPDQTLPDGTGWLYQTVAELAQARTDAAAARGDLTWRHVLEEEVFEALVETDPRLLQAELIQVEAVAARWFADIERRQARGKDQPT